MKNFFNKLIAFELRETQLPTLSDLAMRVGAGGVITPKEWRLAGLPMASKKIGKTEGREIVSKFVTLPAPQLVELLTISPLNHQYRGEINDLTFDPQGEVLAFGTGEGNTVLIDVKQALASPIGWVAEKATCYANYFNEEELSAVTKIAFSPNGKEFAMGGENGGIVVCHFNGFDREEFEGVELLAAARFNANTGQNNRGISGLAFSADSQTLVLGMDDLAVKVYDLWGDSPEFTLHEGRALRDNVRLPNPVAFSPDGKYLLIHREAENEHDSLGITILDWPETLKNRRAIKVASFRIALNLYGLKFNQSGSKLSISLGNKNASEGIGCGQIRVYDWPALLENRSEEYFYKAAEIIENDNGRFNGLIWEAGISPDGTRLASGGSDGFLKVANLEGKGKHRPAALINATMEEAWTSNKVLATAFHPKINTILAAGNSAGILKLYKIA